MNYLALDTNIYINMCLKRKDSVTAPCTDIIKQLLDNRTMNIILPEIVKIEFDRSIQPEFERSKKFLKEVINQIDKIVLPLEITKQGPSWKETNKFKREITKNLNGMLDKFNNMNLLEQNPVGFQKY